MSDQRAVPRPDLRLVPGAAVGWFAAWWGTGSGRAPGTVIVGVCIGVLVGLAWAWRARSPAIVAVCVSAVAMAWIGAAHAGRLADGEVARLADDGAWVEADVVVLAEPMLFQAKGARPAFAVVQAELLRVGGRGLQIGVRLPVRVSASGALAGSLDGIAAGSTVRVRGLATAPDTEPVAMVVRAREPPVVLAAPGPADQLVNRFRQALRSAMAASPARQAALVPSLVVGDTAGLDDQMAAQFRTTALTHLLAVSGANLTLMLGSLLWLAKRLGVRGWWLRGLAVGGVVAFVAVCRAEPSVLRAAAMGSVALAALGAGRDRARGIRHLCVAVLALLLIDPWLARTWGFALSVAASAGILWWGAAWQRAMRTWAPGWLAEGLCIPLAAQIATQPLIVALSGQVSMIGLLANVLAGPFVGPATVLGLLAAIAGAVWAPLGVPFGWAAGWVVQPILWLAQGGSRLPSAAWQLGSNPMSIALVGLCCVVVGLACGALVSRPWAVALLVAVLIAGANWRPQPVGWPGDWSAVFCDVGQGDALVLRAGPTQAVMIDVGPDAEAVTSCLRSLGVRAVPLLILTHYHADHIGGLEAVASKFGIGQVLVSPLASPKGTARRVAATVVAAGGRVVVAAPGDRFQVGEVTWTTVWAGRPGVQANEGDAPFAESSTENDSSVVGVADVRGLAVLSAGDAEPAAQAEALRSAEQLGIDLKAQVLKLPHHGSSRQDERLFRASEALLAVASAGVNNDYGHPARKTLDLAARLGMLVRRTDIDGSISVSADGAVVRVRTTGK